MTPTELAMRAAHLVAAKRALAQAEADLRDAGAGLASMKVGSILRSLK